MSRGSSSQFTFDSTIMFSQLLITAVFVYGSARGDVSHLQYLPPNGNGNGNGNGYGSGNGNGGNKVGYGVGGANGNGGLAPGGSIDGGVSGAGDSGPGEEGGKPEPFSFSYEVKDAESGNDYSHKADSDGNVVKGEYQVLLPDGRRQTVTYTADSQGYNADVQYEGEAITGGAAGASGASNAAGAGSANGNGGAGEANGNVLGRPNGASGFGGTGASASGVGGYPRGGPSNGNGGNGGYRSTSGNGGGNGYPSGRPKSSYLPPRK